MASKTDKPTTSFIKNGEELNIPCEVNDTVNDLIRLLGTGPRQCDDLLFAEGDEVCHTARRFGVFDIDDEELCHKVLPQFPCTVPRCSLGFNSVFEFELHYNSIHRHVCSQCKKQLPSPHLLDLHLSETHDSFFQAQAERKPMYCCYVEECLTKFMNPLERRSHCISDHKFPADFRYDLSRHKPKQEKKNKKDVSAMDVDVLALPKPRENKKKKDAAAIYKGTNDLTKPTEESAMEIADGSATKTTSPKKSFGFRARGRGRGAINL